MTSSFEELGVPADLATRLSELAITDPFPIQRMTLPDALAGRHLCVRAPTGSGKTLAFAIPIAARGERGAARRPSTLVLVPTRELAAQVRDVVKPLCEVRKRRTITLYGGTDMQHDQRELARGVDVVVATPGRLADHVRRGNVVLTDVSFVVVDEADRMADMGFLPEVKKLLDQTSPRRQTLLYSATLDGDVDEFVRRYQNDPVRHELETDRRAVRDVRHMFWPTERVDRLQVTAEICRQTSPTIIFTRTKRGAERLARQLTDRGIATAAIHGDRSQSQRERALASFQDGKVTTLVATDVAARGIHIDDVGVVVHFDLPTSDKDYVHRSGRTGRAGATGLVVSLVAEPDLLATHALQRSLALPIGLTDVDFDVLEAVEPPTPRRHRPQAPTAHPNVGQRPPRRRRNRSRVAASQA